MNIGNPNFIQTKTKSSPTLHALNAKTFQKLKPYYNTVYQLLNIKNHKEDSYQKETFQLQQLIKRKIPKIVVERRIDQQTLQFEILKPQQKRNFYSQTDSSKIKKCKSVTKQFSLSKSRDCRDRKKDEFGQSLNTLRKLSKTLSLSTLKDKKKYNVLDKWYNLVKNHFDNLQLQAKYIGSNEQDKLIVDDDEARYKLQANKWLQNVLLSNGNGTDSLIKKERAKYFRNKVNQLYLYKGVPDKEICQCKQVIQQDKQFMRFSLKNQITTTNINQVKSIYGQTQQKLISLLNQYKNSKESSLQRKSLKRKYHNSSSNRYTNTFRQYGQFKQSQNQKIQNYKIIDSRIGVSKSFFRQNATKKNILTKLKENQKAKYTTKVMDVNRHRKLFLKEKQQIQRMHIV